MYAIGAALDALAAEQAAARLTASDLAAMQRHIDRLFRTTDPLELQKTDEEFHDVYVRYGKLPMRRYAQPSEIAAQVAWLSSSENSYVTGQVLTVDGGVTVTF